VPSESEAAEGREGAGRIEEVQRGPRRSEVEQRGSRRSGTDRGGLGRGRERFAAAQGGFRRIEED